MSYRAVKRLLGETSLERKCRFLFGGGLLILITGSFYFYSWLNEPIVYEQNKKTAQTLSSQVFFEKHVKWAETDENLKSLIAELATELNPKDLEEFTWELVKSGPDVADASKRPSDAAGYQALEQLKLGQDKSLEMQSLKKGKWWYDYYAPVVAREYCLSCHYHKPPVIKAPGDHLLKPDLPAETAVAKKEGQPPANTIVPEVKAGDMIGMVKISIPLEKTQKALALNNAYLLSTGMVTTILAMLAAYAIVRYVIVKPVLHLKDVSDEIARGNLDLRADIRTGDEFEELSHAFNRMLRHLVTVQEELKQVNSNLDGKVDQLAQVNLQLYETNKIKDEFLATMSHELRTPLNSILGFSDVLAKGDNISAQQKKFLNNIQASGKDLMSMISDILNLAKIESGKLEIKLTDFSLADLIFRQVDAVEPLAVKKNIQLSTEVSTDLPEVYSDGGKLQQIMLNLLSNAIKFTPEGGRVHVQVDLLPNSQFQILVEDTGVGVRLEDQTIIFEKFRQGRAIPGQEDAMTREYGGTGLGLSIVKELCRILGGEVHVESEVGRGSTFTVQMPLRYVPSHPYVDPTFNSTTTEERQSGSQSDLTDPNAKTDEDAA